MENNNVDPAPYSEQLIGDMINKSGDIIIQILENFKNFKNKSKNKMNYDSKNIDKAFSIFKNTYKEYISKNDYKKNSVFYENLLSLIQFFARNQRLGPLSIIVDGHGKLKFRPDYVVFRH